MRRPNDPEARLNKDHARFFQMDVACPKKQILLLPGWNFTTGQGALCVQSAVTRRMIDRRTQILCVEHAPANVPLIEAQIARLGLTSRTRFHQGPLHGVTLRPVERFDYAFFDLHLSLDEPTAFWIADVFAPQIVEGGDVSLSVRHTDRYNPFLQTCRLAFGSTYRTHAAAVRDRYGIADRQTLVHALVALTLFRNFRLEYHPERMFWSGPDAMIAFKLTGLHRHSDVVAWPTIQEVAAAGRRLQDRRSPDCETSPHGRAVKSASTIPDPST